MVGKSVLKISKRNENTKLYVPLEFWFCRNVGLALPLIALQYHEVKFKIEFADKEEIAYNYFDNEPYAVQSEGTPTNYYIKTPRWSLTCTVTLASCPRICADSSTTKVRKPRRK